MNNNTDRNENINTNGNNRNENINNRNLGVKTIHVVHGSNFEYYLEKKVESLSFNTEQIELNHLIFECNHSSNFRENDVIFKCITPDCASVIHGLCARKLKAHERGNTGYICDLCTIDEAKVTNELNAAKSILRDKDFIEIILPLLNILSGHQKTHKSTKIINVLSRTMKNKIQWAKLIKYARFVDRKTHEYSYLKDLFREDQNNNNDMQSVMENMENNDNSKGVGDDGMNDIDEIIELITDNKNQDNSANELEDDDIRMQTNDQDKKGSGSDTETDDEDKKDKGSDNQKQQSSQGF